MKQSGDEKFQLKERNAVIIFQTAIIAETCETYGCTYSCRINFFIESLLEMLKANDFNRNGCRSFIVQFPCQKMKTLLFALVITEKY